MLQTVMPRLLLAIALIVAACGGATSVTTIEPDDTTTRLQQTGVPAHLAHFDNIWETDFSKTTIDLNELLLGISATDPRDLIRPIDEPMFESVTDSDWMADSEPGVLVDIDEEVRFYPLSILTRHEIVNDMFGEVPVSVTYCPLCNTALVFDRRVEGTTLRFGVSGLLRNSDLVMWDDITESLWQQAAGVGIVGEHAGTQLSVIPSGIVRWADFRLQHPDATVLAEDQGRGAIYGANPYAFYSTRNRPPLFTGELDDRLPALERVVGVTIDEDGKAFPFSVLSEERVIHDQVGDIPVVVFWGAPDTNDALDNPEIALARGVGTGVAFNPIVEGQALTFEPHQEGFMDRETGSTWSILGSATSGPLVGSQLELLTHRNDFWFAWNAFFPDAALCGMA